MGFKELPEALIRARMAPELREILSRLQAIPDWMHEALDRYEARFPLKEEEKRKIDGYEDFLKSNIETLVGFNRKRRLLLDLLVHHEKQKEVFGRYLTEEEVANLRALSEWTHGEFELLENQIAKAYAVSKSLKEYGWDQHYSEKAELIRKSRQWLLDAEERGELE